MQKDNISILPFNNPLIRFISEKKFSWLRHGLFIILGLVLGFKGDVGAYNDLRTAEVKKAFIIIDIYTFFFIMGTIYLLILVLVPKLLFKSKVFLFAVCFFILVSLIYLQVYYVDLLYLQPFDVPGQPHMQHVEWSFIAYIQYCAVASVMLGAVVGMVIFKKWINDVQRMNELQQANLRTELEQLKSQVNPHFLFNTLNNLLVLVKTDTERASQVLLGLSDLLRYQLYDSAKDKILLAKDIEFIKNLLALEKIRKNDFAFEINTEGNIDKVNLPPFMFIPFVENAIKHGASSVGHSYLTVYFKVTEKELHFVSENSKPVVKNNSIGGIGLKNIKRRLELLYPGKHSLQIKDEPTKYIVNLIIPL